VLELIEKSWERGNRQIRGGYAGKMRLPQQTSMPRL
jgi:hypothetical protein